MMVTPNEDADQSGVYDFRYGLRNPVDVGHSPLATGMMPGPIKGVLKYYVANFLDSTLSVIGITKHDGNPPVATFIKNIDLLGLSRADKSGYDRINGCTKDNCKNIGGLPIQTPVSPDGKYVVTANTLTATILVIDTTIDEVVASLPCDPGCHGVQFGAKGGVHGGYYAYVASKFSNRMLVVDLDGSKANGCTPGTPCIAGDVLLSAPGLSMHAGNIDGTVTDYAGMGGQGVLPIPVVYNGWVQNLPHEWKEKLTTQQLNPFPTH
jgi:DNA-binding beta-propeller fold protein YncE